LDNKKFKSDYKNQNYKTNSLFYLLNETLEI
jgi:hypothetical protein